jgi:hypothetical protein
MIKANLDVLTAHAGQDISPFAKKIAAQNLLKIVGTSAAIMMVANAMKPGSAEQDPRSSDFGKIKVGNTRFDYTGGTASLITLAARMISGATKSTSTGQVTTYGSGYGQTSRFDAVVDFLTGKTTPPARVIIDWMKGKDFEGQKPTAMSSLYNATVPISVKNLIKLKDDSSAEAVLGVLLDALGINTSTYTQKATDWNTVDSKELIQFKSKVGEQKFKEANDLYNKTYNDWLQAVKTDMRFIQLSDDDKQRLITNKKDDIKQQVFKKYNFKYKQEKLKSLPKL